MTRHSFLALIAVPLLALTVYGQSRRQQAAADFDYYMLVLSYAPDYCDQANANRDPRECGKGRNLGFIVHGLWPQGEYSRGPQDCGGGSPVSQAIIQTTLNYIPIPGLIQHEWTNHGTCTGMTAAEYFATLRKARDSVKVPVELDQPHSTLQLSPADIEAKVASANPSFPRAAFRASCYRDAELQEVRVCFTKELKPRACGSSAGKCPLPSVTLLPVR